MGDPLSQLKEAARIGYALIELKRETPTIKGELGHPVDDALRAMIITRQRLFSLYGQEMANASFDYMKHFEMESDNRDGEL